MSATDVAVGARLEESLGGHFGAYEAALTTLLAALAPTAAARDRQGGTALVERRLLRDSGLLQLAVPGAYGGAGLAWPQLLHGVRRLAAVDSSLAHLWGFQHLQIATVLLFASAAQQARLLGDSARHNWFWGNATNALDRDIVLRRDGDGYRLDGIKTFCSGALHSDQLNVSAPLAGGDPGQRLVVSIPTQRAGITAQDDWDAFGQRQSDSGSVHFAQVYVAADEVLGPPGAFGNPRASLRPLVSQLVLAEIYNGNALGALQSARTYLHGSGRPWPAAAVERAIDDPYTQRRYGDLFSRLHSACALADVAAQRLQTLWAHGEALQSDARAALAVTVAQARCIAAEQALRVTSEMFEMLGARATAARWGFDRYWRNVRTHSLHDPLDYKRRDIGRWLLDGVAPTPTIYS